MRANVEETKSFKALFYSFGVQFYKIELILSQFFDIRMVLGLLFS
jgi:hypothetical protein